WSSWRGTPGRLSGYSEMRRPWGLPPRLADAPIPAAFATRVAPTSATTTSSPMTIPPSDHDIQTRQTIVRLLSSMASAKEISQYLKRFSQLDAARFAVVKVGGAVLRDDLDALTSSLAFLQDVGLTPIVLHGAGPQLDGELSAAGIEKQTVNGLRVTSPAALAVVR